MATIALTGATGFIGSHLLDRLRASGHAVHALVRPGSANASRLPPGTDSAVVDLEDATAVARALGDADFVIHAAGTVRGRAYRDFVPANVTALESIRAALLGEAPRARLVLLSSLAATRPELSDYARSKAEGERAASAIPAARRIVLRPPAVYGPGDREMRPLFTAIRRGVAVIPGPRSQRLSLLHVDDLAAAVEACIDAFDSAAGHAYAIDDGRPDGYDWDAIIAASRGRLPVLPLPVPRALLAVTGAVNAGLSTVLGYAPMLTPGKVRELSEPTWLCNNQALTAATAWAPRIPLDEGVRDLFAPGG